MFKILSKQFDPRRTYQTHSNSLSSAWRKDIQCSSVPSTMWIASPNDILWMPQAPLSEVGFLRACEIEMDEMDGCGTQKWQMCTKKLLSLYGNQKAGETSSPTHILELKLETFSIVVVNENRFIVLIQTNKRISQYQSSCIKLLTNMIRQDIHNRERRQLPFWQNQQASWKRIILFFEITSWLSRLIYNK